MHKTKAKPTNQVHTKHGEAPKNISREPSEFPKGTAQASDRKRKKYAKRKLKDKEPKVFAQAFSKRLAAGGSSQRIKQKHKPTNQVRPCVNIRFVQIQYELFGSTAGAVKYIDRKISIFRAIGIYRESICFQHSVQCVLKSR